MIRFRYRLQRTLFITLSTIAALDLSTPVFGRELTEYEKSVLTDSEQRMARDEKTEARSDFLKNEIARREQENPNDPAIAGLKHILEQNVGAEDYLIDNALSGRSAELRDEEIANPGTMAERTKSKIEEMMAIINQGKQSSGQGQGGDQGQQGGGQGQQGFDQGQGGDQGQQGGGQGQQGFDQGQQGGGQGQQDFGQGPM